MAIEFLRDVTVEGKQYKHGDIVKNHEIPAGNLESLLGVKWVREVPDQQESKKEVKPNNKG
jgi:ribosome-binding protein aMBF1 (putative translation factor)